MVRWALMGGVYSNYLALEAACRDAQQRGVDGIFCLGDMGAFGPHPDRVFPILHEYSVQCVQGNYDDSVGHELPDCQCGYTDPRDNYYARISYEYTLAHTSSENRQWLRQLPKQIRIECDGHNILLCHGSPRRVNEFLWESTTSTAFLNWLCDAYDAHIIAATHTGIKWIRKLEGNKWFVNVGAIGRPENDGKTNVWYCILETQGSQVNISFVPVCYNYRLLADEMRREHLPEEFVQTILTGWWTTCLEILPQKERRRGKW